MGSRDRKAIARLCYAYFRVAAALQHEQFAQILARGLFLTESESSPYLELLNPQFNNEVHKPLSEKISAAGVDATDLFTCKNLLSGEIDSPAFAASFLQQPDLFLRLRPTKNEKVIAALATIAGNENFRVEGKNCVRLPNGFGLQEVPGLNRDFVVQDKNSQKVFDDFKTDSKTPLDVWDCCAASGGKSILLYDKLQGNVKLTLTDIRTTILIQAKKRLQEARIPIHQNLMADVAAGHIEIDQNFDLIICDAPCSGSGTWARTPEMHYFFTPEKLQKYIDLQAGIVQNAWLKLKPGDKFVYITCSIFKQENEDVSALLAVQPGARQISASYKKGYLQKADTLYVSIFEKQ